MRCLTIGHRAGERPSIGHPVTAASRVRGAVASLVTGLVAGLAAGSAAAAADPTRGRLLYETHCIACHNSQMHWRDQRLARDWAGLEQQVRHWQGRANLNWNDDDVLEVVRHLNDRIYRYRAPLPPRSAAPDAATVVVQVAAPSPRR